MIKDIWKKLMNNKIWLILTVVICVRGLVYSFYNEVSIYLDTSSYVYFTQNILKGEINALRTPVYPNIIKFITLFDRSAGLYLFCYRKIAGDVEVQTACFSQESGIGDLCVPGDLLQSSHLERFLASLNSYC